MSQTLELYLATNSLMEEVVNLFATDPNISVSKSGHFYSAGLHSIRVTDVRRQTGDDDSYRSQFGFKPTVYVWAQVQRDVEPDVDGSLPGVNTFLTIAGRLLSAVLGDAVMVQNDYVIFMYRRAGVVTLHNQWPTTRNRECLDIAHRVADFPFDGGPLAIAAADAL